MKRTRATALVASLAALLGVSHACCAEPLPGERATVIAAIPGVIAADARWELVWADFKTADGIVGTPDGGVIFAQEQTDTIRKLDVDNREFVYLTGTHGAGSVSLDAQGRLYAVQRTCTDPGRPFSKSCQELTRVSVLAPEQKILAMSFSDGRPLGRLNDLIADGKGGAYFTVGGAYYVSAQGTVSTVAGDSGADGMAIDASGHLYVTARAGVHVLAADGRHLGLIPTPRVPITLAFSGADKKMLYVAQMGAVGPDGKPWTTPEGVPNPAMTIYRIPMLAEGFKGRPK